MLCERGAITVRGKGHGRCVRKLRRVQKKYNDQEKMINYKKQWELLKKSAGLNRLPHALLFSGPKGLGKRSLATKFAKFLIGNTNPPDFILVEPENNIIQISQIRELIQKLCFKPYLADCKIAIIDKAHLMNQQAQNCFLKFLEEPTDKTFLILITAYPAMLLPTILSRVQKIRFFSTKQKELNPRYISELAKLIQSDLATRFQYAKSLANQDLEQILDTWLRYFRKEMLSNFSPKSKEIIEQIQTTQVLLSTTNTNPRLALEILLIKL